MKFICVVYIYLWMELTYSWYTGLKGSDVRGNICLEHVTEHVPKFVGLGCITKNNKYSKIYFSKVYFQKFIF